MKRSDLTGRVWTMMAALCLLTSCRHAKPGEFEIPPIRTSMEEAGASHSFLETCGQLKSSDGFRQNVYLCARHEAYAAIAMDLDHQLYLIVSSNLPARTGNQIHNRFATLGISREVLRRKMDPNAFILDDANEPLVGIFRIPDEAGETFGLELINHLLNLNLTAGEQSFQWD